MIKDLNIKECFQIIGNNYIGFLSYWSGSVPVALPITYYFDPANDNLISYSLEGNKIDAMRKHKSVTLLISEVTSINQWKSVLVTGVYEELDGTTAKEQLHKFAEGVKELVNRDKKMDVHFISDFSRQMHGEGHPIVYRIKIIEITGKQRLRS